MRGRISAAVYHVLPIFYSVDLIDAVSSAAAATVDVAVNSRRFFRAEVEGGGKTTARARVLDLIDNSQRLGWRWSKGRKGFLIRFVTGIASLAIFLLLLSSSLLLHSTPSTTFCQQRVCPGSSVEF